MIRKIVLKSSCDHPTIFLVDRFNEVAGAPGIEYKQLSYFLSDIFESIMGPRSKNGLGAFAAIAFNPSDRKLTYDIDLQGMTLGTETTGQTNKVTVIFKKGYRVLHRKKMKINSLVS